MKKLAMCTLISVILTGCATSSVLNSEHHTTTSTKQISLINDDVVAFGTPADSSAVAKNTVVIVGEKYSYVLTQGGQQATHLFTTLNPNYIQVTKPLNFYSANNDGKFTGTLELSYTRLKSYFKSTDYDFMLQNQGRECSTQSDMRMNAQRFCFEIAIEGGVYPAVSNLSLIQSKYRALSKPYQVSIYTNQTTSHTQDNTVAKLVALPFAIAFDVVTLPVQILANLD